jgi:hypothetical protein
LARWFEEQADARAEQPSPVARLGSDTVTSRPATRRAASAPPPAAVLRAAPTHALAVAGHASEFRRTPASMGQLSAGTAKTTTLIAEANGASANARLSASPPRAVRATQPNSQPAADRLSQLIDRLARVDVDVDRLAAAIAVASGPGDVRRPAAAAVAPTTTPLVTSVSASPRERKRNRNGLAGSPRPDVQHSTPQTELRTSAGRELRKKRRESSRPSSGQESGEDAAS